MNNDQAKIITDQIPKHLNRVLSVEFITEYLSEKDILVTNKYQEIPALINIS
jgi:succinyl-CoA synthetase alpha subunit